MSFVLDSFPQSRMAAMALVGLAAAGMVYLAYRQMHATTPRTRDADVKLKSPLQDDVFVRTDSRYKFKPDKLTTGVRIWIYKKTSDGIDRKSKDFSYNEKNPFIMNYRNENGKDKHLLITPDGRSSKVIAEIVNGHHNDAKNIATRFRNWES